MRDSIISRSRSVMKDHETHAFAGKRCQFGGFVLSAAFVVECPPCIGFDHSLPPFAGTREFLWHWPSPLRESRYRIRVLPGHHRRLKRWSPRARAGPSNSREIQCLHVGSPTRLKRCLLCHRRRTDYGRSAGRKGKYMLDRVTASAALDP